MAVLDRIENAKFLWKHGRREGAFLAALIAVAATSRKRFPDRKANTDREAFGTRPIVGGCLRGQGRDNADH